MTDSERIEQLERKVATIESLLLKLAGEWMEGSDDENCSAPGEWNLTS